MPEPAPAPLRPSAVDMLRTLVVVLASFLLLAGCGSAPGEPDAGAGSGTPTAGPGTSKVGRCPADSPAVVSARTLVEADLDGEGGPEAVRLTAADGDCPNLLFAELPQGHVAAQLPIGAPVVSRADAVEVPGRSGALVVTRQDHPRGGFQLRIFAAAPTELVELTTGQDDPLVPFVALDVDEHPLSVDCTDGGVVLTEALPDEGRGRSFAWDVRRTTYSLEGTEVTRGTSREIAGDVPPEQLRSKYPDLVAHRAFASCRAGR